MDNVEIQVTRTVFWRKKTEKLHIYTSGMYISSSFGEHQHDVKLVCMHYCSFWQNAPDVHFFVTFENIQHCLCKNRWKCQTVKQMSWPITCDINKRSFYVWRQDPFWLSRLHTESSVFLFCFFLRWKRSLGQVTSLVTLGRLNGLRYPRSRYKER